MSTELERIRDQLAYEAAKSDIECFCPSHLSDGGLRWFDTSLVEPVVEMSIARALAYLNSVNLLVRNPAKPALVRVKEVE